MGGLLFLYWRRHLSATKNQGLFCRSIAHFRPKRKEWGESVYIALKDDTAPDDGSESKILLNLTNEWAIYTIPLTAFETADLKRLFVVPSFIFQDTPQAIKIKNI